MEERRLHNLTHCPARPWCKHRAYGAAAEYPHRTVVGEVSWSEVPSAMLAYCFFKENASRSADEHTEKEEATVSLIALVLKGKRRWFLFYWKELTPVKSL